MRGQNGVIDQAASLIPRGVRLPNNVYRIREHLTEAEVGKLLAALKSNRHGHRDHMIGLVITGMVCVYQKHATGAGMTSICASAPAWSACIRSMRPGLG
jgi:hypothetical protein